MKILKSAAAILSRSPLLARGRTLWDKNQQDVGLSNRGWSKWDKLQAGGYLILSDYAAGHFPPQFPDRQTVFENEGRISDQPGSPAQAQLEAGARKPFWGERMVNYYLRDFSRLIEAMESHGVLPPARVLELGSGSGWMAEWLVLSGYDVMATSVGAGDAKFIEARAASIRARGLPAPLAFRECPMEEAGMRLRDAGPFQAVIVYEALHHAYSWKETIAAVHSVLPSGGWFFICNEPNVLHTFISYRVAKLHQWHEVGISRGALIRALQEKGFDRVDLLRHRFNTLVNSHWIAARRGP